MRVVNIALVKSIKIVLKSTKVLGRDLSEKDNINLFFFHSAVASPTIGGGRLFFYVIKAETLF